MNKFMFNVKQLKMNEFIKYISQLIICTSNATLEVLSLHPWFEQVFISWETILLQNFLFLPDKELHVQNQN